LNDANNTKCLTLLGLAVLLVVHCCGDVIFFENINIYFVLWQKNLPSHKRELNYCSVISRSTDPQQTEIIS